MDIEHRDHWLPESCQHLKAFWSVNKAKVIVILYVINWFFVSVSIIVAWT